MNYSTTMLLLNKDVRLIEASYQVEADSKVLPHHSIILKVMAPDIKVGDFVVMPTHTRHGMTVGRVERIDVPVNYDGHEDLKWAIDVVDMASHKVLLEKETAAIKIVESAEARSKQEELRTKLLADNPELAGLDIVNVSAALPAPPAPAAG